MYDLKNVARTLAGGLPWTEAFIGDIQDFGSGGSAHTELTDWLIGKFNAGASPRNEI